MSNQNQLPKPNADITDYEWELTPPPVRAIVDRLHNLISQKQETVENLQFENKWLRQQLDLELDNPHRVHIPPLPEVILWATVGLILTIGGTFLQAYTVTAPWFWLGKGIEVQTLGVSYQIGAVLLTACVGGKNAALLSQVIYLSLGLLGLPIFDRGGGWQYLLEPNFGYLLGFILGAWLCGFLAFQSLAKLSRLIASCAIALIVIHLTGIIYLIILACTSGLGEKIDSLWQAISIYSLYPLPGQFAVICAVSLIALLMRKIALS
jgi:biotin transport system substrate-specific component